MNQAMEQWDAFAAELAMEIGESGGSCGLWDIYIFDTTLADWTAIAHFIVDGKYAMTFLGSGSTTGFPSDMASFFSNDPEHESPTLSIDVSGVVVNYHFFGIDEVEFDIDPREIIDVARLDAFFTFMQGLADATGKDVVLTPENARECPIFRCRPGDDGIEHIP